MKIILRFYIMVGLVLLLNASLAFSTESNTANETSKYLNAVRTFADNVLKYGRDTYGPKKTPLFVDGLNIHDREPVRWIEPNGDRWVLSNLSSQQTLFRTLNGLTTITGDPKYRQATMEAIRYEFENLQTSNGLLPWGGHQAYDASADKIRGLSIHELKGIYPDYELMWKVNTRATSQYIEAFWSAHIIDWSNLDMNRHAKNDERLEKPWNHEYKSGPVFDGEGLSFFNTASDLIYAAVELTRLSGNNEPLVWAKRLARRYVEVRDPNTGISYGMYTSVKKQEIPDSYDSVLRKLVPGATDFPVSTFPGGMINPKVREVSAGYRMPTPGIRVHRYLLNWQSLLIVGETLGSEGAEFKQWALEELTAFGKFYRKMDNVYIPMLTDGTNLEGYVVKVDGPLGPKGVVLEPVPAGSSDLWAYAMCYRVTDDTFMWEMARDISKGCGFGDIGKGSEDAPQLNLDTGCSDPYAILSFLELHRATGRNEFLDMAKRIGSNVLDNRFYKGFFLASKKHSYSKFDTMDSLALLHLYSVLVGKTSATPSAYPATPFFEGNYRMKEYAIDNQLFYTFTEFAEPPMSIQEAAAVGDIDSVRTLLDKGVEVDAVENTIYRTALHRSVKGGHKEVVKLLLAKGANVEATDEWPRATPLYYGAMQGHREIVELLIAHGADINTTIAYPAGDMPIHSAARAGHKDVLELLIAKGADVNIRNGWGRGLNPLEIAASNNHIDIVHLLIDKGAEVLSLHAAAYIGDQEKVNALLNQGSDVNEKDSNGFTPLFHAVTGGHKGIIELLIAKGADVDAKNNRGETLLLLAVQNNNVDAVKLLISAGANVNVKNKWNWVPLHFAAEKGRQEIVELLIEKGAELNVKNSQGNTPLDVAMYKDHSDIARLLIDKGASVSLHVAVRLGDQEKVKLLIEKGADVNVKNNQGQTPLDIAINQGQKELGKFLVEKNASASIHELVILGLSEQVKERLDKGIDVYEEDEYDMTPLAYAAFCGHTDIVDLLVAHGVDINTRDQAGNTPLFYAVFRSNVVMVEFLLQKGAEVNIKNKEGLTPLDVATRKDDKKMVEILTTAAQEQKKDSEWIFLRRIGLQDRAWIYYGSPGDSTQLKFDLDTTNASIGTHTLKVEITPVPGERNTEEDKSPTSTETAFSMF